MISTGWSFWNYEKEETSRLNHNLERLASHQRAAELGETSKFKAIARAFKNRTTLVGALFVFAYQGAEVSESGWFISYLIDYRNGDPAHVGYVTSGFWAGITLGRFVLTHLARRVGEKRFVYGLGIGVIAFQLLAWLVPNVIGDSGELNSVKESAPLLIKKQSPLLFWVCCWAQYIRALRQSSLDCYRATSKSSRYRSLAVLDQAEALWYHS